MQRTAVRSSTCSYMRSRRWKPLTNMVIRSLLLAASDDFGYGVQHLLKAGAKWNVYTREEHNSALFEALVHRNFVAAEKLIEAGADVNEFGIDTYEVGDESTVEEKKTKETVLQAAVRHAKDSDPESAHELFDLLLKTVRSIDDLNENGQTALMIAVSQDNGWIARRLCDAGANPDIQDHDGQSASSIALYKTSGDIPVLFPEDSPPVK